MCAKHPVVNIISSMGCSLSQGGGRVLWRPITYHPGQGPVPTRSQQLRRHTRTHMCLQSLLQLEESTICMNYFLRRSALGATMWVEGIALVLFNLDEPSHFCKGALLLGYRASPCLQWAWGEFKLHGQPRAKGAPLHTCLPCLWYLQPGLAPRGMRGSRPVLQLVLLPFCQP